MKKRLSNDHLNLVCKSIASYQKYEVDNMLSWRIKNTSGFEKAENVKKLKAQRIELGLLDELKEVLDKSLLTSKKTENDLVNGINESLEEVFTGETETQKELRELRNYATDLEAEIAALTKRVEHLSKPWWKK
tara:strand:+ start:270 stop:668 length:399 start_codon:yes stop_codon:yes gene_type:complete